MNVDGLLEKDKEKDETVIVSPDEGYKQLLPCSSSSLPLYPHCSTSINRSRKQSEACQAGRNIDSNVSAEDAIKTSGMDTVGGEREREQVTHVLVQLEVLKS